MNHSILIIDDVPQNIILLKQILEIKNFLVITANSSQEALQILKTSVPDLILLDVIMPEVNGFDFCRILKENELTKEIPVIFLSALSDMETKLQGLKLGSVDYITKPFDSDELIERVKIHLKIKDLEKENKRVIELLQRSNLEKEKLFQVITHDMKSPLTSIILYAEMMRNNAEEIKPEKIKKFSDSIYNSCNKILDLIRELTQLTKVETNLHLQEISEFNLYDFIFNISDLFQSITDKKNIKIKIHSENKNLKIKQDQRKLNHVLSNLISNSIKFSKPESNILIQFHIKLEKLFIQIIDEGIGIPESLLNNLFDRFSKAHRSGTNGEEGTGLGMYITRDFIVSMNGQIQIESKVNRGTTVTLVFDNF